MLSYEAGGDIAAPPETVWQVLVDGANYPTWDSGVVRVEGEIVAGGKIKVFSEISPDRAFPVTVSLHESEQMVWTGGMPLGLFKGVRTLKSPSPRSF